MRRTETLTHEFAPINPQHSVYIALTEADRTQADRETCEISVIAEPFGLLRKPRVLGSGLGSHPSSLAHPLDDAVGLSLIEVGTNPEVVHADHPSYFGQLRPPFRRTLVAWSRRRAANDGDTATGPVCRQTARGRSAPSPTCCGLSRGATTAWRE